MCVSYCHLLRLDLSSHKLESLVSWLIGVRVNESTRKGERRVYKFDYSLTYDCVTGCVSNCTRGELLWGESW